MDVLETIAQARDTMTVKRVFGEPYEKDGVTIITAAAVMGGAGGGGSEGDQGTGGGSGFGVMARPAGAYVFESGRVSWRPAIDMNRVILGGQVVALVALLAIRSILKVRARTRRALAKAEA